MISLNVTDCYKGATSSMRPLTIAAKAISWMQPCQRCSGTMVTSAEGRASFHVVEEYADVLKLWQDAREPRP